MRVAEIMSREVEFIAPDASVQQAAELMGELEVGALPVGDAANLHGVVTDRDILYRVVAAGRDPVTTRVGEVTSHPIIGCAEDDTVQAAMDLMAAHHIRRLAVRDPAGSEMCWKPRLSRLRSSSWAPRQRSASSTPNWLAMPGFRYLQPLQ